MRKHRSIVVVLVSALAGVGASGCASKAPQEKSAADAMRATAVDDRRACYDEFGYRRADVPYAFCRDQPQYYVVEERRPAPRESVVGESVTGQATEAAQGVTNAEPVESVTGSEPARTVLRPSARAQPLQRPGIGVTRMPVPVPGGIGVFR